MKMYDPIYSLTFKNAVHCPAENLFQNAIMCKYSHAIYEFESPSIVEGPRVVVINRPNNSCDHGKNCLNLRCNYNRTSYESFIKNNHSVDGLSETGFNERVKDAKSITEDLKEEFDTESIEGSHYFQCPQPFLIWPEKRIY